MVPPADLHVTNGNRNNMEVGGWNHLVLQGTKEADTTRSASFPVDVRGDFLLNGDVFGHFLQW